MAVDAGSNAIRWRVWDLAGGAPRMLAQGRDAVRLGGEAFKAGRLSEGLIARVVDSFRRIEREKRRHDAAELRAVATSAMREAANAGELIDAVGRVTGIELEILDADEEARLIALGVLGMHPEPPPRSLILDVGGGSSEVILARRREIVRTVSLPLGAVRLTGRFFPRLPPTNDQCQQTRRHIEAVLDRELNLPEMDRGVACLGSGGALWTLARMAARAAGSIMLDDIECLVESLRRLGIEQTVERYGIERERAEIILAGAMIAAAIARRAGIGRIELTHKGVGDGLVIERIRKDKRNRQDSQDLQE
jgi:exopolyphosphatase/guanosine-5'-triphosphate,3'-diphosphate pyrophosphatase